VRTFSPKAADVQRQWHVIDASDVVLGRLASHVAILLRGKHKPIFAPHLVRGMLPKNTLGRNMLRKLKVYAGPDHPHQAQQPTPFTITQVAQPAGTPSASAK